MNRWFSFLYLVAAVVILALVGQMDYEDAVAQHDAYCKNVREGVWPDYKEIFDEYCKISVDDEASSD